jgi:hypothetical protein
MKGAWNCQRTRGVDKLRYAPSIRIFISNARLSVVLNEITGGGAPAIFY